MRLLLSFLFSSLLSKIIQIEYQAAGRVKLLILYILCYGNKNVSTTYGDMKTLEVR